jgi:hypothetical protein
MKTKMKTLLLLPFFALLLFTSCQEEVLEVTPPVNESETITATSELTSLMSKTSIMDGSKDNIIDKASCLAIELPVKVVVHGLEISVDSIEDYKVIEAVFDEFEDDDDNLEFIFPITIIKSDYSEIVIANREVLHDLIENCQGENEPDDDIECIDFQYPISFSVYNSDFQVINTIKIEDDRQLYRFIKRVREGEVFASLNFPVTMALADGTTVEVRNNKQLQETIEAAKDACDEDDDNDHNDDDFTKERLDTYLIKCPWLVNEFKRNAASLTDAYFDYAINFKEDGLVVMRARNGDVVTGTWSTRITDRGALLKMTFENLADFTLEWYIYEIEEGKIKIYEEGGSRIIMKRNCNVVIDYTKERVENYLQECLWRIARLRVNGADNEKDYIGTPLKFYANNIVKIRINGESVAGTYEVLVSNIGIGLRITLEGRPDLKLEWLITFLEPGLIKLENANNKMILERHCPDTDDDLSYIEDVLVTGTWEVAKYDDGLVHVQDPTVNFNMYTINFLETGRIKITDPNNGITAGSWLAYRNEGLHLGMYFGNNAPFNELIFRWVVKNISPNRIELKDLSSTGAVERILVLEKKN